MNLFEKIFSMLHSQHCCTKGANKYFSRHILIFKEISMFFYLRKDIYGIFAFPVTDAIAPNYSSVVTNPMDFSTMMYKIENLEYPSLEAFKVIHGQFCVLP